MRDFSDAWAALHESQYGHRVLTTGGVHRLFGCILCEVYWFNGRPEYAEDIYHLLEPAND